MFYITDYKYMCHSMFKQSVFPAFHTMVPNEKYSFSFERKKTVDIALYVKILSDTVDVIITLAIK